MAQGTPRAGSGARSAWRGAQEALLRPPSSDPDMRALRLALALGLALLVDAKWFNSYAGPFVATMGPRWERCQEGKSENLIRCNIKVSQFRNHALEARKSLQRVTGNITLDIPLDDSLRVYMKGATRSNNEWKDNAVIMNFPGGACTKTMENFPDFAKKIYKLDASTHKGSCSVAKGVYFLNDEPVNWTVPKITSFAYGMYRLEIGYNQGSAGKTRSVMCFQVELQLQPLL